MEELKKRVLEEAKYFLFTSGATVRSTAKAFGVSKSTVYKDITEKLDEYPEYASLKLGVEEKLLENKKARSKRGGEATRKKYLEKKHKK